jgi:hypothetical protein
VGSRPAAPRGLTLVHLSRQLVLLYCCCLRPLLFPLRRVRAATAVPMMGRPRLSWIPSPATPRVHMNVARWSPGFSVLVAGESG